MHVHITNEKITSFQDVQSPTEGVEKSTCQVELFVDDWANFGHMLFLTLKMTHIRYQQI